MLPVCPHAYRSLLQAGPEGRTVKVTGERPYAGYTVTIFQSRR
jgi:hypothetical protein